MSLKTNLINMINVITLQQDHNQILYLKQKYALMNSNLNLNLVTGNLEKDRRF